MTAVTTQPEMKIEDRPAHEVMPIGKAAARDLGLTNHDDSQFANLLDTGKFEHMYRVAQLFSSSQMIPAHYQNQAANCFIAVQMAVRLGVDPFMFMQNTYIVHGRPGMEAKLAIALINTSGMFQDTLDYEIEGDDPSKQDYRVRAFAVRRSSGKKILGPWIDWKLVKSERWDSTNGSKWKTMPGQMFCYRAAMFFGRLHCPERLMGMQTADELTDVHNGTRHIASDVIEPSQTKTESLTSRLTGKSVVSDLIEEPKPQAAVVVEPQLAPDNDAPSELDLMYDHAYASIDATQGAVRRRLLDYARHAFGVTSMAELTPDQISAIRGMIDDEQI